MTGKSNTDSTTENMQSENAQGSEDITSESGADFTSSASQVEGDETTSKDAAAENYEKFLRTLAEFENFKKRTVKERSELLKYQGEPLVIELLGVLDNLELALQHKGADADKLRTGLEMTYKGFLDALKKFEIRPESALGKTFDPTSASAISRVPASEENPAGTVVGELKKAFYYKDRLIRVGEVVVAVESN